MGTTNSANDEWVELYNDGENVSLDGWTLSDGVNLSIALSGTIAAGAYAVLERTDDDSAPGTAFLLYTGTLSNSGSTLTLTDSVGRVVDRVVGGENWETIGGDNVTKDTAQRTDSDWITAAATPGERNVGSAVVIETTETETVHTTSRSQVSIPTNIKSKTRKSDTELRLADTVLALSLDIPDIAYVNQPVTFSIEPSGISERLLDSVQYQWNFGDLGTAARKNPTHTYSYPGVYVVMVEGEYKRHRAIARHEILVLPVMFSLTKSATGDLHITNEATYEVDLSGYSLRGEHTIVFPAHTVLLPESTITVPRENYGGSETAWLMDQKYKVVASLPQRSVAQHVAAAEEASAMAEAKLPPSRSQPINTFTSQTPSPATQKTHEDFSFAMDTTDVSHASVDRDQLSQSSPTPQTAAVINARSSTPDDRLPYLGLIGVLAIGILALYAGKIKA